MAFPNIEVLTLVFVLSQEPPARTKYPSLFLGTFPSFPDRTELPHLREVHSQLLPRDRRHDVHSVFPHFRSAMNAQLSMYFREPRFLRCSIAEPPRHFLCCFPIHYTDLVNL
jgi:hypothetical protein